MLSVIFPFDPRYHVQDQVMAFARLLETQVHRLVAVVMPPLPQLWTQDCAVRAGWLASLEMFPSCLSELNVMVKLTSDKDISRLAQLVERVTSNDEVSRSSRLMGISRRRCFFWKEFTGMYTVTVMLRIKQVILHKEGIWRCSGCYLTFHAIFRRTRDDSHIPLTGFARRHIWLTIS